MYGLISTISFTVSQQGPRKLFEKKKKMLLQLDSDSEKVFEYFRDHDELVLANILKELDFSGKDVYALLELSEESRKRANRLTKLQIRRISKILIKGKVSKKRHNLPYMHLSIFIVVVIIIFSYIKFKSQEHYSPNDSTLLVIAGLEGTGHHMWHQYVFPELSKHGAYIEHFNESHALSLQVKEITKYPFAFIPNQNKKFSHGKNALEILINAFTNMQRSSVSSTKKNVMYVVDICSFPCGPDRTHGHDPDLRLIRDAARRANPPLKFRVLLQWRDHKEAVASATYNRKCCFVDKTLAVPYQANVLRVSLMHMNNQLSGMMHDTRDSEELASLDYNRFVDNITTRENYVRAMSNWLALSPNASEDLDFVIRNHVKKPRVRYADQMTVKEFQYLEDLFETENSKILWSFLEKIRKDRDLVKLFGY